MYTFPICCWISSFKWFYCKQFAIFTGTHISMEGWYVELISFSGQNSNWQCLHHQYCYLCTSSYVYIHNLLLDFKSEVILFGTVRDIYWNTQVWAIGTQNLWAFSSKINLILPTSLIQDSKHLLVKCTFIIWCWI